MTCLTQSDSSVGTIAGKSQVARIMPIIRTAAAGSRRAPALQRIVLTSSKHDHDKDTLLTARMIRADDAFWVCLGASPSHITRRIANHSAVKTAAPVAKKNHIVPPIPRHWFLVGSNGMYACTAPGR